MFAILTNPFGWTVVSRFENEFVTPQGDRMGSAEYELHRDRFGRRRYVETPAGSETPRMLENAVGRRIGRTWVRTGRLPETIGIRQDDAIRIRHRDR